MKVSEMIKNLTEFMAEHGDLDCWYAKDDEGNGYREVHFKPSKNYADEDGDIYQFEDLEYYGFDADDVSPICIVN